MKITKDDLDQLRETFTEKLSREREERWKTEILHYQWITALLEYLGAELKTSPERFYCEKKKVSK